MPSEINTDFHGFNYLVVDDEAFIRTLIVRILVSIGVDKEKVTARESGLEAIDFMGNGGDEIIDMVICDLNMPDMDGIEFLRHLALRSFAGGIVLVSGEDTRILKAAEELAQAHSLKILGALPKPLKPDHLSNLLSAFDSSSAARGNRSTAEIGINDLAAAISERQISVVFQPKLSTSSQTLIGVETLARWIHPEKGFIPPDIFVHLAEENNLVDELTSLIIDLAIEQGASWLKQGLEIKIAINLSVDNLNDLDLTKKLEQKIADAGLQARNIILEVTESRLMVDITKPLEILTRLRMKGFSLSIDDFGTGHSSLEQLKRIPFTELKIDRAFVDGAAQDPATRAILESSVDLAKKLEMSVVAEGVERREDWDLVASLGCDLVQGYFVARPMPGDDILAWKEGWSGISD
ncbi:MAG: EAL domain-containing response regulator [Alphaproteobacteria bacterium]|jgi:EAL domain-containing protein (putative c-di-GMP-specific phosphodiesterase class I)/AmiR/NasT family two-component response regulator|nr:EAL domain-containing response regulator [Alphaproteobacteria bacterium]MBT4017234.1 EAL domain-containing response regulator [Alphaproteobacteria bacterium]MBT5161560.1 EAL domain-containing response regulator [Alphaproteobacteria bacterium]